MIKNCDSKNKDSILESKIGLDKEWLSYNDICFLYGKVSKKHLWEIRNKYEITVSKHPLNDKEFIYLKSDIETKIKRNTVYKRTDVNSVF